MNLKNTLSLSLKEKVSRCENLIGTHVSLNDPVISEIFGSLGYDFIWIDTEHTAIDYKELEGHIAGALLGGTPPIVRVSMHDINHVKRVLEMGPAGVVFPMINTAEEAEQAMKYTLYPPKGVRGFGPRRAVRFGLDDIDQYIKNNEQLLCRLIQIETKTAVENLPEIIKNPYIDGYIFGPCDLSGSIGELNHVFGENNIALIKRAIDILKKENKSIGISTGSDDPNVVKFWHEMGINMISAGCDTSYLLNSALTNLKNARRIFAKEL